MRHNFGEPFNPWREACGFYPPDIVARRRDLTNGQKLLYDRAVRWAGRQGRFWYGFKRMATELGKSDRQIKRDMAELERYPLIRHLRRGKRQSNAYEFLWHAMFESDGTSASLHPSTGEVTKTAGDGTPVSLGDGTSTSHEFRNKNCVRESSSSEPTTTSQESQIPRAWTDEQITEARNLLAQHRGSGHGLPDVTVTRKVLENFDSMTEVRDWLNDLSGRFPGSKVHSWGFYPGDARTFMSGRREEERIKRETEAARAVKCDGVKFADYFYREKVNGCEYKIVVGYPCYECEKGRSLKNDNYSMPAEERKRREDELNRLIEAEAQRRGEGWASQKQAANIRFGLRPAA